MTGADWRRKDAQSNRLAREPAVLHRPHRSELDRHALVRAGSVAEVASAHVDLRGGDARRVEHEWLVRQGLRSVGELDPQTSATLEASPSPVRTASAHGAIRRLIIESRSLSDTDAAMMRYLGIRADRAAPVPMMIPVNITTTFDALGQP